MNKSSLAATTAFANGLKHIENSSDEDKRDFRNLLIVVGAVIVLGGCAGYIIVTAVRYIAYYIGYGIINCLSYIGSFIF